MFHNTKLSEGCLKEALTKSFQGHINELLTKTCGIRITNLAGCCFILSVSSLFTEEILNMSGNAI